MAFAFGNSLAGFLLRSMFLVWVVTHSYPSTASTECCFGNSPRQAPHELHLGQKSYATLLHRSEIPSTFCKMDPLHFFHRNKLFNRSWDPTQKWLWISYCCCGSIIVEIPGNVIDFVMPIVLILLLLLLVPSLPSQSKPCHKSCKSIKIEADSSHRNVRNKPKPQQACWSMVGKGEVYMHMFLFLQIQRIIWVLHPASWSSLNLHYLIRHSGGSTH